MPLTMMQKRTSFKAVIQAILTIHDDDFTLDRVDTVERKALEQNQDRKSRIKHTGSPAKYVTLHDVGQSTFPLTDSVDAAGNVDCFIGHIFNLGIFWQKDYQESQDDFEAAIYNARDHAKPGFLDSIRSDRVKTVGSDVYRIGLPGEDAFRNILRGTYDFGANSGKPDFCHYLGCQVVLL